MWRRFFILGALCSGIAAGVAVSVKSPRLANTLAEQLQAYVKDSTGLLLQVERVELDILPPTLKAYNVSVFRPDASKPFVSFHNASLRLSPWPSSTGAVVIDRLEVDSLNIDIDILKRVVSKETQPGPPGPSIDVRHLSLFNSRVRVRTQDGEWRLTRSDLTLRPAPGGGRQLTWRIRESLTTVAGEPVAFESHGEARLHGSLDRPEGLTVQRARVFVPRMQAKVAGQIRLGEAPMLDLKVTSTVNLAQVARWAPTRTPPLRGQATLTGSLAGPIDAPRIEVDTSVENLSVGDVAVGSVRVEGRWSGEHIELTAFDSRHPKAGRVTGSGRIKLASGWPVQLNTRLYKVSLPHVLDTVGFEGAWVRLGFNGNVSGEGTLTPLALALNMNGTVDGFAALNKSYLNPDAKTMVSQDAVTVEGPVYVTASGVEISRYMLRFGTSALAVDANFSFDKRVGMDLRAASDAFDLSEVGPIAGIPMSGRGAIAATVEGRYASPLISGTTELDGFQIFAHPLGATKATLIYERRRLALDRIQVRRGNGAVTGSGRFMFGPEVTVEGAFDVQNVALRDVLAATVQRSDRSREDWDAQLSGRVLLSGALKMPDGIAHLKAPALVFRGRSLGPIRFQGGMGPGRERRWGELVLGTGAETATVRLGQRRDGVLAVRGTFATYPLAALQALTPTLSWAGQVSGSLAATGRWPALTGSGSLRGQRTRVGPLVLGDGALTLTSKAGNVAVIGSLLSQDTSVKGSLVLGSQLPFSVTAGFSTLALQRVFPVVDRLEIVGSGTLFAQGDLTEANSVVADLSLTEASLAWGGLRLGTQAPVKLSYGAQQLELPPTRLEGDGVSATAGGAIRRWEEVRLDVSAEGDAQALASALERVDMARGPFRAELRLRGPVGTPRLSGLLRTDRAVARLRGMNQRIEDIALDAVFAGRTVELRPSTASLGGGQLEFTGEVLLPDGEDAQVDMRGRFRQVTSRPYPGVQLTTSGDMNLVGPIHDLMLKGRVRVERLRYTANLLDLRNLVPKRTAPPLRVPTFQPGDALALRVAVTAPRDVVITSNVLEAELQAELLLTGTTERVGILGTVSPLWARARFRDNVFEVEQAAIDFTEEFRVHTQFDVLAKTEACGMQVEVAVNGDSDGYAVSPSGRDATGPVENQDVLTCLTTGMRFDDRSGYDTNLRAAQWGVADALWSVSGLDSQVKRLIPIDRIRLTSGWSEKSYRVVPRFELSQEVGSRLVLKENFSLVEPEDHQLTLEYRLSPVATVQGGWVSISEVPIGDFGVDLRLRWEIE